MLPIAQEVEAILGRSTVFYDDWYEHWIAGLDADLLLQGLYDSGAGLVVVCVSGAYGDKPWTRRDSGAALSGRQIVRYLYKYRIIRRPSHDH